MPRGWWTLNEWRFEVGGRPSDRALTTIDEEVDLLFDTTWKKMLFHRVHFRFLFWEAKTWRNVCCVWLSWRIFSSVKWNRVEGWWDQNAFFHSDVCFFSWQQSSLVLWPLPIKCLLSSTNPKILYQNYKKGAQGDPEAWRKVPSVPQLEFIHTNESRETNSHVTGPQSQTVSVRLC